MERGQIVAETERVQLHRFAPGDAQGFLDLNADPEVLRYTGDPPFADLQAAQDFIASYDHYDRYGFGRWSVYLQETGEFAGFCGLKYMPEIDEVDLGFRLKRPLWGQGLATETGRLSLAVGFGEYDLGCVVGRAMKENPASHAVLIKLGMTPTKEFQAAGDVWCQYEISRPAFESAPSLREIQDDDLPTLFRHQQDEQANHMAGFTAEDPHDEDAFMAKMQRIMANPEIEKRVIVAGGKVVGNVMGFEMFGEHSVCYWIDREYWGRGYATAGLLAFIREHKVRPLCARVADDNVGSIRVLQKCGFVVTDEDVGFAHGRGEDIRELIMHLNGES